MNFKHLILITTLFLISCSNMSLAPEVVRKSDVQKQQYVVFGNLIVGIIFNHKGWYVIHAAHTMHEYFYSYPYNHPCTHSIYQQQ